MNELEKKKKGKKKKITVNLDDLLVIKINHALNKKRLIELDNGLRVSSLSSFINSLLIERLEE
jgi:hypothetical protein